MGLLRNSRFNPTTGLLDFWNELRKPNPYRWPILAVSLVPFGLLMYYFAGETQYKDPERPQITYITSFAPDRSDEEIAASNLENQEVKELREAYQAELTERKRDAYKALGAASGMDVEEIEQRGAETRAREEAERRAELDRLMGRTGDGNDTVEGGPAASDESSVP